MKWILAHIVVFFSFVVALLLQPVSVQAQVPGSCLLLDNSDNQFECSYLGGQSTVVRDYCEPGYTIDATFCSGSAATRVCDDQGTGSCCIPCVPISTGTKAWGESCTASENECAQGLTCRGNTCLKPAATIGLGYSCQATDECASGSGTHPNSFLSCTNNVCRESACLTDAECQRIGGPESSCDPNFRICIDFARDIQSTPLPPFEYCAQVPGDQKEACETCMGGAGLGPEESKKIYTAVGCIATEEQDLAADLIQLLLGLAGGVALLSILAGGFIFTTSQGESNRVKEAKELITAAVSGLLFIIFVVIILDFIGVKILQIPGLG